MTATSHVQVRPRFSASIVDEETALRVATALHEPEIGEREDVAQDFLVSLLDSWATFGTVASLWAISVIICIALPAGVVLLYWRPL
jgi:hypothetical protein